MKRRIALFAVVAASLAAGVTFFGGSSAPAAPAAVPKLPPSVFYGHIQTLTRKGGHYEMKFDPAWWLTGLAAQRAKLEDTGSRDVPNDYYIVEEGHRLLTFAVTPSARVTVLVGGGASRARVSVAELAQIVRGRNPMHRRLSERKAGFWIRIGVGLLSPAVTLDQQYQP
jgi:hypothetical protein